MRVIRLPLGPFETNAYLVAAPGSKQAVIVDPAAEPETIEQALRGEGWTLEAVLLTHGHADHVSAAGELARRHGVAVYLHPADAVWAFTEINQLPPWYSPPLPPPEPVRELTDGARLSLAGLEWRVLHTPGHTPGGVCFQVPCEQTVFCGDLVFQGSVGRTDLPGGDPEQLRASIRRLCELPASTRLWPGHGPPTTLAAELRFNPFF
ncbi:MAG: MBL fold metallo-hydrolase [Kiritimatiellae bacterium]|nr:MBL fold metallo-hydrolase [Kiritimatiellia bacterium]